MEHIDWQPRKWRTGTRGMTPLQRAIYFEIINEIYLLGEPIPEDEKWLAGICGVRVDVFKRTLRELKLMGKVRRVVDVLDVGCIPVLSANHCDEELNACRRRMENSKQNGKKGGRPSRNQRLSETPGLSEENPLGFSSKTPGFPTRLTQYNKPLTPSPDDDDRSSLVPALADPEGPAGTALRDDERRKPTIGAATPPLQPPKHTDDQFAIAKADAIARLRAELANSTPEPAPANGDPPSSAADTQAKPIRYRRGQPLPPVCSLNDIAAAQADPEAGISVADATPSGPPP